jgi:hypothetical protein
MFFTGVPKANYPWYMMMTTNEAEAIDVFVEEVEGGLRLYFTIDGTKTYLDMHKDGTHYSLRLTTEPTAVYTWNTEYKTFVTMVDDKECFIGTSGTYDTFSCNKMEFIATSYVAHLYGEGGTVTPEQPTEKPATLAEQIAAANKLANKQFLPYQSTITGTITDDPMASSKNEGYYKFTVSDGTNTLLCYFVRVEGGTPKKGDTVTVTGKLTAYNGSAQFEETSSVATLAGGTVTPEQPEEPEQPEQPVVTGTATLATQVAVGDKIVLVNAAGDSAMGAQNDKKRDVVAITVTGNTASLNANVVIITLEKGSQEGTFALKVADGYLAYTNNGNAISTQETVDDAASWTITIVDGVVTIQNVGNTERFLQYNISAPRFVCYKGTQEAPVIYKVEE